MIKDNIVSVNLGCRLNSYEISYISSIMKSLNMFDFAIVNTCTVTNESEKKSRKEVRKLKKQYPNKKILVTGCASELHSEYFKNMPEVEFVISNDLKKRKDVYNKIFDLYSSGLKDDFFKEKKKELQEYLLSKQDKSFTEDFFDITAIQKQSRSRAFIEIQNGCNHYCSFCIIPFTRGKMQSRSLESILDEIDELVKANYNEIVLTGVDITDYGIDLYKKRSLSFLCREILDKTNVKRLRLSSVDVAEIDQEMIEIFTKEARFMPYFHISLQAGSNNVLKKMRRRHTREQVYDFIKKVKSLRKNVGIGADIITGFANETLEEFEDSVNIVKDCDINFIHAFPYSKKEKTLAHSWSDDIEKNEKKRRVSILIELGKQNLDKLKKDMLNTEQFIILEIGRILGKAENFIDVYVEELTDDMQAGDLLQVFCYRIDEDKLIAKVLKKI